MRPPPCRAHARTRRAAAGAHAGVLDIAVMEKPKLILAVDGGGSASRAAVYDAGGGVLREAVIGPLSRKSSGDSAVAESMAALKEFLGADAEGVRAAVLGLSGLDSREDNEAVAELLEKSGLAAAGSMRRFSYGFKLESAWGFPLMLCSDALLPLFGCGLSEGAVVVAGTGSVALRIGAHGSVERFGGWGYRTSDEGSGCWIGCELAREALHVADGLLSGAAAKSKMASAERTLLEEAFEAMRARSGARVPRKAPLERKASFVREWACGRDDPKEYAALAKAALESRGSACRRIRLRAAERLAGLARCAFDPESPAVVLSGGLFANACFAEEVSRAIAGKCDAEGMQVIVNTAPPTAGAYALAKLLWPERPQVPEASSASVRKSMQANKGADTKPEMLVRRRLREAGIGGYRLHWRAPGKPDVAWPSKKVCIFINGCFWHRHEGCSMATTPKSNTEYWIAKFDRNVKRDAENLRRLQDEGWRVHVVWECELRPARIDDTFEALVPLLKEELGK